MGYEEFDRLAQSPIMVIQISCRSRIIICCLDVRLDAGIGIAIIEDRIFPLFTFATMGISMGSSVLSSRFYGAKDNLSLKKTITLALRFSVILACIFTFLSIFFPRQIISLYFQGRETEIIAAGVTYLRWSIPSFLLMAVSFASTARRFISGLYVLFLSYTNPEIPSVS